LALVFDEVFCEIRDERDRPMARPDAAGFPLAVTLNGFSKMLSLPGWKIAWLKTDGDAERVEPFLKSLEHLADTYLPVPDLQQAMVAELLATGESVMARLAEAYRRRRQLARAGLRYRADETAAGVYLCLRLAGKYAQRGGDEAFALAALEREGVLVHPGYFYDLPGRFVMTASAAPEPLAEGIARLNRLTDGG
jgi:aspartate/methionine/tyrosine aminotransferase